MFESGLRCIEGVNVDAILLSTPKKALIINELRHKAINYDEAIANGKSHDYQYSESILKQLPWKTWSK